MNTNTKFSQRGIGVIEVMVAAAIFALGIVALIQLQGVFFKNSSAAQARSVAATLAEEKLEDLRSFNDSSSFEYLDIVDNGGGDLTSGPQTIGNTDYTLSWDVTGYYYNAGVLTTTDPANAIVEHKSVIITVSWIDADGTAHDGTDAPAYTLEAIINSNSGTSGGLLANNTGGSGENPVVPYIPSNDDRVNPISVGVDSKRETLVPETKIVDGLTQSKFTAYTYNSSNILLRQEEFVNVACNCAFDGTSSVGSETYAVSYPAWDSGLDSYKDVTGDLVANKVQGCVDNNRNGNCDSNPDRLCNICCRDHHDTSAVARKYDPYRSSDDFDATTGNHNHYNGENVVTSGVYQESCRLKRVDGFYRVFQDWHMVNYDAVTLADLLDSSTKTAYADYIQDVVDQHIDESKVQGEVLSSPPSEPAATNHNTAGNYVDMTAGDIAGVSGRALYIDYIDAYHLGQVQAKKSTGTEDYLLHMPFYELEAASVADWESLDDTIVETGPIASAVAKDEIRAVADNANAAIVNSSIRKSNTGLTQLSVSLDYNASSHPDDETNSDSLTVCVGGSCSAPVAGCVTPWGVTVNDGDNVTAYLTQAVVSPALCASETRTCAAGTLSGSYQYSSCSQIPGPGQCATPWGEIIDDGQQRDAYLNETPTDACDLEVLTCNSGVLTQSPENSTVITHEFETCTVTPVLCGTTVTGQKAAAADSISIASDDPNNIGSCSSNGKNYSCNIETETSAVVTVTSNGVDITLGSACGIQSGVDF